MSNDEHFHEHIGTIFVFSLILMTLYNVSINKKGLKYISAKPGILGVLAWLLQGIPGCSSLFLPSVQHY